MKRFAQIGAATVLLALLAGGCSQGSGTSSTGTTGTSPPPASAASAHPSPVASAHPSSAASALATPMSLVGHLTVPFRSPVYGYSIRLDPTWTVAAATIAADDPRSTEETGADLITVTGTDTAIPIVVSDLGGQAFGAWLEDYRAATTASVPPGCDGGDPSTWPAVTVGDRQGVWQQKCNAAVAIVEDGGKAYQFPWENGTFTTTQHLGVEDFKAVLATVTFPSPAASPTP
jgi:hypothetical protein